MALTKSYLFASTGPVPPVHAPQERARERPVRLGEDDLGRQCHQQWCNNEYCAKGESAARRVSVGIYGLNNISVYPIKIEIKITNLGFQLGFVKSKLFH